MAAVDVPSDTIARTVAVRRQIHRFPEAGFEEEKTAALVERELDEMGIPHRRVAKTGVIGVIEGKKPGKVAALRADMDALPITEQSGEPFSSEIPGMMHACGHDAHTAMLLGAARELTATRNTLAGKVVLLFQPAEEGPGGALPMIEEGALDDPRVDAVAMLHVDQRYETGTLGIAPGPVNAAADELYITIVGVSGHGAAPHRAVDAIPCAGAVILALQNIASREIDPLGSIVVTVGTIEGGYRNNVIADKVAMSGTIRTFDPEVRKGVEARVRRIVGGVAAAYNCKAEIMVVYSYPAVVNDAQLATEFSAYMMEHTEIPIVRPAPTMGAEDFAYFAERVPGLLIRLGVHNEAIGAVHYVHSPQFKLDEAAFPTGITALVEFARTITSGQISVARPEHNRL
ncbi:MAG TPA: M20 family metallopeptidase [Candidatus Binatia bacterium]|nr:M20 family metallopeptidase [Candidatus Binatia bacterium]